MEINLKYFKRQGYEGASSMSGQFQGSAAVVREYFPQAVYVHVASHFLNLALFHSCNIPGIINCFGTLKEVINYFRISPKRFAIFAQIV